MISVLSLHMKRDMIVFRSILPSVRIMNLLPSTIDSDLSFHAPFLPVIMTASDCVLLLSSHLRNYFN
jgi:hypothetical protein